jgi:hypothetical protein
MPMACQVSKLDVIFSSSFLQAQLCLGPLCEKSVYSANCLLSVCFVSPRRHHQGIRFARHLRSQYHFRTRFLSRSEHYPGVPEYPLSPLEETDSNPNLLYPPLEEEGPSLFPQFSYKLLYKCCLFHICRNKALFYGLK